MTKEEKSLKNDVLDILEDYLAIAAELNKGQSLSVRAGRLDNQMKETKKIIHRFRDAIITEEK